MTRTRTLAAALVAAIALVAAGCGGDDESVPAATQWAGDVCTAVNTWRSDIAATARRAADPALGAGMAPRAAGL